MVDMGSRTEFPPERVDEVPQRFHARRKASGIGHHEPRLVAVELCPAVIHFDNRVTKVHQTCAEHEREVVARGGGQLEVGTPQCVHGGAKCQTQAPADVVH